MCPIAAPTVSQLQPILTTRFLVVTANPKRQRLLRHVLRSHGFQVLEGTPGDDLPASVAYDHPDLMLLDLAGLSDRPEETGDVVLALLRTLRALTSVPIVVLATEPHAPSAVATLNAGADEHLTWPIHTSELVSRIRAILRRVWSAGLRPGTRLADKTGEVIIDLTRRTVQVQGHTVILNAAEWRLLTVLGTHTGKVLTHEEILTLAFGTAYRGDVPYLRVMINRLRSKLDNHQSGTRGSVIRTHFGIGYELLVEPVPAREEASPTHAMGH